MSIVIPAHNEERYILQMLQSLSEQKYDKSVEVIVVDNNSASTDRTSSFVEQSGARVIKYNVTEGAPESEYAPTALARQKGLEAAKGRIIISSDGDGITPHGWISAITEPLDQDPTIAAVTGGIVHYDRPEHYLIYGKDALSKSVRKLLTSYRNVQGPSKKQKSSTSGANTAFRKTDAERIGGYDLYKYPGQDTALGYSLSKIGRLVFIDSEETRVRVSPRRFEGIGRIGILKTVVNYRRIYRHGKDKTQIVKR